MLILRDLLNSIQLDQMCAQVTKLGAESPEEATKDIEQWRKTRHEKCSDPSGWLTLVGLHWLRKGDNTLGLASDNSIQFTSPTCSPHLGVIHIGDHDSISFTPAPDALVESDGKKVSEQISLRSDVPDDNPTQLKHGSISFFVIKRGQRLGIRVKDSQSEVLRNFKGIPNFPVNLSLRLVADFVPHETPKKT